MAPVPPGYRVPDVATRIALVAHSFARLLGRPLVDASSDPVAALWHAPQVIVAHGTQADPVFFFGNAAALDAFDTDVAAFTALPSRLSAEAPQRDERARLLARVARDGFIDDYAGVRISQKGRRFTIAGAVVWNLVDAAGAIHGQAATFATPRSPA